MIWERVPNVSIETYAGSKVVFNLTHSIDSAGSLGMDQHTCFFGMLCLRDNPSWLHILVCMLRMGLQNIQEYIDMRLHYFFFGSLHLTHMGMDYMDQ